MGRTSNKKSLKENSIDELEFRKRLANTFLDMLRTDPEIMDDPRAAGAIEEYERQLMNIQAEIDRRQPPDIVVGLQPGTLISRALKG